MHCQEIQERLLRCRDEIELLTRPDVIGHLEKCAGCRLAWEEAQSLNRLLDSIPADAPPDHFTRRVLAAVEVEVNREASAEVLGGLPLQRSWTGRRRWLHYGAARFTDWALAMATTFVVFTMGWSLIFDSRMTALAKAGPEVAFALTDWWPRVGLTLVGYADRFVSLFGAS